MCLCPNEDDVYPVVVAKNPKLDERTSATPAIADDTLYVRTEKHLYAFSDEKLSRAAANRSFFTAGLGCCPPRHRLTRSALLQRG
jgi:hypothetical protein